MKSAYEAPKASRMEFDYTSTIIASGVGTVAVVKNPGKGNCTVMPGSGKPVPETAVGHTVSKNKKC